MLKIKTVLTQKYIIKYWKLSIGMCQSSGLQSDLFPDKHLSMSYLTYTVKLPNNMPIGGKQNGSVLGIFQYMCVTRDMCLACVVCDCDMCFRINIYP